MRYKYRIVFTDGSETPFVSETPIEEGDVFEARAGLRVEAVTVTQPAREGATGLINAKRIDEPFWQIRRH